jgi:DNA-binding transcriptional ArsR family regulator
MTVTVPMDIDVFADKAEQAAEFLRSLAHRHRLMILCKLMEGERSVGALNEELSLTPSNLSQHLARLREEGLVEHRREGTTLHYRLVSDDVRAVLGELYRVFCA